MSTLPSSPSEPAKKARSEWVDLFRGICIILVVMGHVIGGLVYSDQIESKGHLREIYEWIYSFHMPAFFWVSGLFALQTYKKLGLTGFIGNKAATLYYPYLLWGILGWLIHMSVAKYTNTPPNAYAPLTLIWNPSSGHWFLIVLFFLMILAGLILKAGLGPYGVFAIATVGWIARLAFKDWNIPVELVAYAASYGIYFAAGIAMGTFVLRVVPTLRISHSVGLFALGMASWIAFLALGWHKVNGLNAIVASSAVVWLVGLSRLLSDLKGIAWLKSCGKYSLQIYLLHAYPTVLSRIILIRFLHQNDITVHAIVNSLVGIVACLIASVILERIGLNWLFRFPERKRPQAPVQEKG